MNIPKKIIEKAIEGGWSPDCNNPRWLHFMKDGLAWRQFDNEMPLPFDTNLVHFATTVIDPTFWQALGKELGWNKRVCKGCGSEAKPVEGEYHRICPTCNRGNEDRIDGWQFRAHRFYNLLLTGGDTDAFWKELLTK